MADGSIMIETKLSTNKFDKQIQKLDEKIQKKDKEKIKLEADIKNIKESEAEYDELIKKSDEYGDKLIQAKQKVEELTNARKGLFVNGKIKASEIPQYENYGTQIEEAETKVKELNTEIANTNKEISKWDNKLINNANKIEAIKAKQAEVTEEVKKYKNQIESVKLQKQQSQVDSIKNNFEGVSKSVGKAIGRVARLALGVISVASAYRLMSSASSTLGQYDEQYATNLEYIRYLIAQVLAPALQFIVKLAGTLLAYLNYIVQAWFKIPLFAKDAAKNFAKAQGSTTKMKKDLQTTPFDEMNVLSDTSSSGTSGEVAPSIDPSMLQGEIPDWLQWIVDHKDEILAVMAGAASGLFAWQLGLSAIKALGIGVMIAGIIYTIESLLDYLKDPSWENFGKIIQGIGIFVIGLGVAFLGLPAIITGVIIVIVGTIIKYWEQIKAFLQSGINWLKSKSDWVHEMFGEVIGNIYDAWVKKLQLILNFFDNTFKNIKSIFDDIISFIRNVFAGNWKDAWENIKDIFVTIWNQIKNKFVTIFSLIKNMVVLVAQTTGTIIAGVFKAVVNAVLRTIESVLNAPIRAINRLIRVINNVPGINLGTLSTFNLPRLAKGTILNAPGRGVPVAGGTALAGEAGREAYLPLSDTQLLEELGSTIGKYITINANIPVSVGNRQIARVIKKINTESDFAFNR